MELSEKFKFEINIQERPFIWNQRKILRDSFSLLVSIQTKKKFYELEVFLSNIYVYFKLASVLTQWYFYLFWIIYLKVYSDNLASFFMTIFL